jgi:hypothetical protein
VAVLDDALSGPAWVAGLYRTREYAAEKRIALAVCANRLDAIVTGSAAPYIIAPAEAKLQ